MKQGHEEVVIYPNALKLPWSGIIPPACITTLGMGLQAVYSICEGSRAIKLILGSREQT